MKTIYLSKGELNEKGEGNVASIKDLNYLLCCGEKEILGVFRVSEGIYTFFNNLASAEDIESVGEICEYIKISDTLVSETFNEIEMSCQTPDIRMLTKIETHGNNVMSIVKEYPLVALYVIGVLMLHAFVYFSKIGINV